MKSKIFNTKEIQAIIAGNKTMFREVCKIQPSFADQKLLFAESSTDIKHKGKYSWANVDEEKLNITNRSGYFKPKFKIDQEIFVEGQESPITLKIKSVKVERLQDISEEDAIAEGIEEVVIPIFKHLKPYTKSWKWYKEDNFATYCAKKSFGNFWNLTHKKQEDEWETNPWVFVYEFEVIRIKK